MAMPDWAVHRDQGALEDVTEKLRHANPPTVILVDIATGCMVTDGAIPGDRSLQPMRHAPPSLPSHIGGLSPKQFGVLAALRDGARIWRQWPERENDVPPCDSQYRAVKQETAFDWSCAPRWKVVDFTLTEGQMTCTCTTARAENPRGRKLWLRLKEFVRRAKLDPLLWGYAPSRCHSGGSERKTAHHATDSLSRDTLGFECGVSRNAVGDRSCSLFYPPLTCGDGEHQHGVAAYRRRRDITSPEYLHELDPQPRIALIVADHGSTTEEQRARMVNVDICLGSQSQRRGNKVVITTLKFVHRARAERDYLLSTMY